MMCLDSVPNLVHTEKVGPNVEATAAGSPGPVLPNSGRTRTRARLAEESRQGGTSNHRCGFDARPIRMADRHAAGSKPQGWPLGSPIQPAKSEDRAFAPLLSRRKACGAPRIH